MNEIYGFLRLHKELALATVGKDGKPKIRVFQIMKVDDIANILYFATSPKKEVYNQLEANPSVELLAMAANISVRISGEAVFKVHYKICREIYDTNPVLPRLYKDYRDLVYFCIPIVSLTYYDLSTEPPTFKTFTF